MKHISILVPRGATVVTCLDGCLMGLGMVNVLLEQAGKPPAFKTELVGLDEEAQMYNRYFHVRPTKTIDDDIRCDLIIIPPVNGDMARVIDENKKFLPWIEHAYSQGTEVASLCVGAFLLAATGILDGKSCATHWTMFNEFRRMFPQVHLVSDKVIVDEDGVYSSGGALSFWNLLLYLIEKYTDRDMAIMISKFFAVEIDRESQSDFIIFTGQKAHNDDRIKEAQTYIEKNYQDKISVDQLSCMVAMGKRSFERRFKNATGNTVLEYIQRVKIEAAKRQIESGSKNINEVMYDVGYMDSKAFRNVFKKTTGLSPAHYRSKYNKIAEPQLTR